MLAWSSPWSSRGVVRARIHVFRPNLGAFLKPFSWLENQPSLVSKTRSKANWYFGWKSSGFPAQFWKRFSSIFCILTLPEIKNFQKLFKMFWKIFKKKHIWTRSSTVQVWEHVEMCFFLKKFKNVFGSFSAAIWKFSDFHPVVSPDRTENWLKYRAKNGGVFEHQNRFKESAQESSQQQRRFWTQNMAPRGDSPWGLGGRNMAPQGDSPWGASRGLCNKRSNFKG